MTGVTYPSWQSCSTCSVVSGSQYTFAYDNMGRLNTMTDSLDTRTLVSGVTYGVANEVQHMTSGDNRWVGTEARGYNSLFQLTQIQVSKEPSGYALNMQYTYSATQNNGKITSETDALSGEQIAYTYDALNRLASAQTTQTGGTQWGQSYTYDGFGNLTDQTVIKGSAPDVHVAYNASNNLQTGDTADANGNIGSGYLYDLENRIVQPGTYSTANYGYDVGNRRVWRGDSSSGLDEITFWAGQKLATYQVSGTYFTLTSTNVYFGGKLISKGSYSSSWNDKVALAPVVADRLGSIGKFYPYGTERPSATANDKEKFTGYFRDASTGLDYADQRYEQPGVGRFTTPDSSGTKSTDPATSNKYAYAGGDPVNRIDPTGRYWEDDEDYNDLFYFPDVFNEPTCLVGDPAGLLSGADSGWIPCSPTSLGGGGQSTDPPPLECTFAGMVIQPTRYDFGGLFVTMPISIDFDASGGNGIYTWDLTQELSETTTYTRLRPRRGGIITGKTTTEYITKTEHLPNAEDDLNGSHASFVDSPAIQVFSVGNFIATGNFSFTAQATVSSGGQTVKCPIVVWTASVTIKKSGRKIDATGVATQDTP